MLQWLPLIVSPFVGSFLANAVVENRTPVRLLRLRSVCDHCRRNLSGRDLLPIISWLLNRGRCRSCNSRIDPFYPIAESLAVAVAVSAMLALPTGWMMWISCGFGWALIVLALIDFRELRLPDPLSLPLIPLGLAFTWLVNPQYVLVNLAAAITAAGFLLLLRFFFNRLLKRESLGLGDIKLVAAAGTWLGPFGVLSAITYGAIFGLGFGLWQRRFQGANALIPFGSFLCLGIWVTWLYGPLTF